MKSKVRAIFARLLSAVERNFISAMILLAIAVSAYSAYSEISGD